MKSVEQQLLANADKALNAVSDDLFPSLGQTDARLTVLEAVASLTGGWDLTEYQERAQWSVVAPQQGLLDAAQRILSELTATDIPVPLGIAALAREVLPQSEQRKTGAYYTDWRLAELLGKQAVERATTTAAWIDTACGSGTLLVASLLATPPEIRTYVIENLLVGADLSARALRGTQLAIASMTPSLDALIAFGQRLFQHDSLRSSATWRSVAPAGASLVIGNPPWERLRVTRHEISRASGADRHYGQSFEAPIDISEHSIAMRAYIEGVAGRTRLQGGREHDLYKLFLELGLSLLGQDGGVLAMLLPAGLIRAQGTEALRKELNSVTSELSISVIENRARNFAIDSRFKFLSVVGRLGRTQHQHLDLRVANRDGALPARAVRIDRQALERVRPDLSLPEVRNEAEWRLYERLASTSTRVGDPDGPWHPTYLREVDMTSDSRHFQRRPTENAYPLIEGRHVSHFRWRAKRYVSGEGRAAVWSPQPIEAASLRSQWFIPEGALSRRAADNARRSRLGFCDITGQTNERTLMLARLPAGVVCGNKVPTLRFEDDDPDREDLFLALANSLVVDWMLRRVVTTTVNFFVLDALPLPSIEVGSAAGQRLAHIARTLTDLEGEATVDATGVGKIRAELDAIVAHAWDINIEEMELVLDDFPLLDRGQPPIFGERKSSVTADSVLTELSKLLGEGGPWAGRQKLAIRGGAAPYVPAEYVSKGRQ